MRAILISVGDELVLGQTVDTNAAWLSARLAEHGIMTAYHTAVPDDKLAIVEAVLEASRAGELVIVSGGLGPTPDDITRDAMAEVMGAPLKLHRPSLDRMKRRFAHRELVMPESCRAQAMTPEGAGVLENTRGTAPGLKFALGRATVFVVPGVPSEMKAMFSKSVAPELNAIGGPRGARRFLRTLTINTFGCGESVVADRLGDLMRRDRNPVVGTTVSDGIVSVRIRSEFADDPTALAELRKTARTARRRLGNIVFGEGYDTLQDAVGRLLLKAGRTIATAESCTAGLLGKSLTDPPGSSAWYLGGWIVYCNRLKNEQLGVPLSMLKRDGAVSEPVARCMAEQALARSGADYSIAITGIAGPAGAARGKPVGTVWIAVGKRVKKALNIRADRHILPGTREAIRDRAVKTALNMLRLELMGNER